MKLLNTIAILTLITACASYEHVRPGANGVHRVLIRGPVKEKVETKAIREARSFCQSRDKDAAFVSDSTKYTGSMTESTHKTLQKISRASIVAGGMLQTQGANKEKNTGKGLSGAGVVGNILQDDEAYTADMTFECI